MRCSGSGKRAIECQHYRRPVRRIELTLQIPHATVHSSLVADAWFAWHSMPTARSVRQEDIVGHHIQRSIMWLRQMAQLSTTISQAHRATAFHFLTSKRFLPGAGASFISTSAMMICRSLRKKSLKCREGREGGKLLRDWSSGKCGGAEAAMSSTAGGVHRAVLERKRFSRCVESLVP